MKYCNYKNKRAWYGINYTLLFLILIWSPKGYTQADGHIDPSARAHLHNLSFARHVNTTFNATTASQGLQYGTSILQKCDSRVANDQDVSCQVTVQMSGSLGTFGTNSDGFDVITTEAEQNAVLNNNSAWVKVVTAIMYCGGPGTFAGCARQPGSSIVIESGLGTNGTGYTVIHEFGHNKGLPHRNSPENPIMAGSYSLANNEVNLTECAAYHSGGTDNGPNRPVDVAFIIDDTGSMSEEIAGVRNALLAHLGTYCSTCCGTVFQLTTFKDNVTERDPTTDLAVIQSQVAALVATGGGDCPEASVEAINQVMDKIKDNGRAFFATDAAPHPGLDLGATIATLKSRGIRVDIVESGDCPNFIAGASHCESNNNSENCADDPKSSVRLGRSTIYIPTAIDPIFLGDDDFQEVLLPFAFPFGGEYYSTVFVGSNGFITFGEGNTDYTESVSDLVAGPRRIAGLWDDLYPPSGGTIEVGQVGTEFHIIFDNISEISSSNSVTFRMILRPDGTFNIEYDAVSILDGLAGYSVGNGVDDPGEIDLSTAPQPIVATGNGTAYEIFTSNDNDLSDLSIEYSAVTYEPPIPLYKNGIEAFSLMANETGGIFSYIPEVNGGDPSDVQRFENTIFNIIQGGITQSIAQVQPPFGPVGSNLTLTITGAETNFQSNTSLSFDGGGISITELNTVSPIQLETTIDIDAGASLGFRDMMAITDLGGGVVDTARGVGAFEVISNPGVPTILGISPPSGEAGQALSVTVYGLNTNFSSASMLDLGSGIIIVDVTALSPQILQADIQISTSAEVGFRDVIVTTGAEVATENVTGPFFISQASPAEPEIVSITPDEGAPETAFTVTVVGENTSFIDGISVLSFSGTGINIVSTDVSSPTSLTAPIQIDPDASPGFRDVRVTTGTEIAVLLNGFFVSELVESDALIWIPDDVLEPDLARKALDRGLTLEQIQSIAHTTSSHLELQAALEGNSKVVHVTNDLTTATLSDYPYVFVVLGIFPNNHVIKASDPEAVQLESYLTGGGKLYIEGGDVWYQDQIIGGYDFAPSFSINAIRDGFDDLKTIQGSCVVLGMDFVYKGHNNFIDRISPSGLACSIHANDAPSYDCGVAFDNPAVGYRTIGNSFEFGGLADNSIPGATTKVELMTQYLDFFDNGLISADGQVIAQIGGPSTYFTGCFITAPVMVDLSRTDELLGDYSARLTWDPALLEFVGFTGGVPPFDSPVVQDENASAGELTFEDFYAAGGGGEIIVINVEFKAVGDAGLSGVLAVSFSEMIAAGTHKNLLPITVTEDANFVTEHGCLLGDVTNDNNPAIFDAFVIANYAVGNPIPAEFLERIEQGCGDVTLDGLTRIFDAFVIANYAVGNDIPVEFPVSEPFCPEE